MLLDILRLPSLPFGMALAAPAALIAFAGYILPVGQVSYWLSSKIHGE